MAWKPGSEKARRKRLRRLAVVEANATTIRALLDASRDAQGLWKVGIGGEVAEKLRVSRRAVRDWIAAEIKAGRLVNPRIAAGLGLDRKPRKEN